MADHPKRLFWVVSLVLLLVSVDARADSKAEARRYFTRGMAFIDAGRYREGIEQLEKAYAVRPHPNVLFNIGRAYASMGSLAKAIEYFEKYQSTSPSDAARVESTLQELRLRFELRRLVDDGMRAIKRKRYLEGIALLNRAYEQRPHPNILFNIGRAYEDAGQVRQAIATYERYLETSPRDAKRVTSRLTKLRQRMAAVRRAAVAEKEPPPPPPPTKRRRRRTRDEPTTPETTETAEAPAPAPLEGEQLDRLAEAIIARMRAEGAFDRPESVAAAPTEPLVVDHAPPVEVTADSVPTSTVALGEADVSLEAKTGEVYEDVVVTASRRAQSPLDAPNAVTILTDEDVRLSGARTIPDLLRRVPGMDVMAMSYSDYNVAVRGFNRRVANKVLVLIDGRTAYQDFLGGTLWTGLSISLPDIERIEVVRGPGSAIYGAYAYTGIVNIITKRPSQVKGSTIEVAAGNGNQFSSTYQYGGQQGPVSIRASGTYQRADKYDLEFDPNRVDYTTNVADPNKSLDMARIDLESEYALGGDKRLYAGGAARTGSFEFYGVASLRNQAIDGEEYNLRGGYDSDLLSIRTFWNRLRVQSAPQFYRTGTNDLGSRVRFDLVSIEPVFRPEVELFGKHAIVLGGEYRFKFIDWDYLNDEQTENHFAAFFQDSWVITPEWSTILSARLDLHPLIGPLASPRLAVIFKPTPNQAIRLSAGTAFRQPTMAETYLDLSASTPVPGAAITLVGGFRELDPERIVTVDAGYRYQSEFGEVEAVAYFNRVTNLITRTPLEPTGADEPFDPEINAFVVGRSLYVNDPRAFLALGGEVSTRLYPIDGVDVGANYALQVIFDEETGDRFTDSPVHKVSVWGLLRTSIGLDVGLSGHFVSSQKWVEPNYDPADPTGFNTDPLPVDASVLVIGRVGYRLFDDNLELAVVGTNLLDFGDLRHREHPFANRLEARVLGTVTARF